jgi:excisionase family DNA binding protein
MRSRLSAVPPGRAAHFLALFEQLEAGAGELSAGEVLEAVGRSARLEAMLRARYAALAASAAVPLPTPPAEANRYLGAAAAATYLGISKATVVRLVKAGTLPVCRPSEGTVRFDRADLDAHMAGHASPAPPGRRRAVERR